MVGVFVYPNEPVDPAASGIMKHFEYRAFAHPAGGDIDIHNMRICGDSVCQYDQTATHDAHWEWLRRSEPAHYNQGGAPVMTVPSAPKFTPKVIQAPTVDVQAEEPDSGPVINPTVRIA